MLYSPNLCILRNRVTQIPTLIGYKFVKTQSSKGQASQQRLNRSHVEKLRKPDLFATISLQKKGVDAVPRVDTRTQTFSSS